MTNFPLYFQGRSCQSDRYVKIKTEICFAYSQCISRITLREYNKITSLTFLTFKTSMEHELKL